MHYCELLLYHIFFLTFMNSFSQKSLSSFKSSAMSNEAVLNEKCMNMERKIHDLTHNLKRMDEEKSKYELEFRETLKQEKEKMMQVIVSVIVKINIILILLSLTIFHLFSTQVTNFNNINKCYRKEISGNKMRNLT